MTPLEWAAVTSALAALVYLATKKLPEKSASATPGPQLADPRVGPS